MSKTPKGFTLIELLVVISIIAILSSIVLASLNSARIKAKDVRRLADLKSIQNALALFYHDNGVYPGVTNQFYDVDDHDCNGGYADFSTIMPTTYISSIPKDFGALCGWYQPLNNKQGYYLMFDPDDNSFALKDDPNCYVPSQATYYCVGVNYP